MDPYRPWRAALFALTVVAAALTVGTAGLMLLSLR